MTRLWCLQSHTLVSCSFNKLITSIVELSLRFLRVLNPDYKVTWRTHTITITILVTRISDQNILAGRNYMKYAADTLET